MRTTIIVTVAATALVLTQAAFAQKPEANVEQLSESEPGKVTKANVVKVSASVESIDRSSRTVTLKGPAGRIVDVVAGPEVKNFDRIKVGDLVVVRYLESLSLELKKDGKALVERTEREGAARSLPGEKPAVAGAREVTATGDVTAVNPKTQTITVRGPNQTVDIRVNDPAQFARVKKGDQIEAVYTQAAAISLEPVAKKK